MGSRSQSALLNRCSRCFLTQRWCLCAKIPSVASSFEIVIIRHLRESYKTTNTARLAALAIQRCTIIDYLPETFDESLLDTTESALLFPSEEAPPKKAPTRLYVLDGTWAQASRMTHKIRALSSMPRVAITAPISITARIRQETKEHQRSTLEAIAMSVAHFDGEERAAPLLELYRQMAIHVSAARGFPIAEENVSE
jgi:DTW domain-containing protein YfiP